MRLIQHLVLCVFFLLYTNSVLAQRAPACCDDADCPMVQCVGASCVAQTPVAAASASPAPAVKQLQDFPGEITPDLPIQDRPVWTPPD